eukprot:3594237-Rhodomonas_salina.2
MIVAKATCYARSELGNWKPAPLPAIILVQRVSVTDCASRAASTHTRATQKRGWKMLFTIQHSSSHMLLLPVTISLLYSYI